MKLLPNWQKRSFWFKSTVGIASGTAIGHVATALGLLFIARLYTDDGVFAVASAFMLLLTLLAPLATLRFEMAIPTARDEQEMQDITGLCFLSLLLTTGVLTLVLAVANGPLFSFMNVGELSQYWWLLPVGFLGNGIYGTLTFNATKNRQYKAIAITKGTRGVFASLFSVVWGFISPTILGLVLAPVAGAFLGISYLFKGSGLPGIKLPGLRRAWETAKKQKQFAIFGVPATFANSFGFALPTFMVIKLFGQADGDSWALATRLISLPALLVGTAIGQVFMGEVSAALENEPERLRKSFDKVVSKTMKLAIVTAGVSVVGGLLLPFILGAKWQEAGYLLAIMSFSIGMLVVVNPASVVTILLKRQDVQLMLDVLRILLVGATIYIPHALGANLTQTAVFFSLVMLGLYTLSYLAYKKLVTKHAVSVSSG